MDFSTNRHSIYKLTFHLVVVTKYRHKCITINMNERLKEIAKDIFPKFHCDIIEMETEEDHCHILFDAKPQTELVRLVNNFKTVSSRLLRKEFKEHLKPFLVTEGNPLGEKPKFWGNSYCLVSTGGAPLDIVAQYVRNQDKPKH